MTISIGRVGVPTAYGGDGLTLNEPFAWSIQGDQVTLEGLFKAASDTQAARFQSQILGLGPGRNPDEQAVPVMSTGAPTLDGYYEILTAEAVIGPGALGSGHGLVKWAVTARRARDHVYPNIEIIHSFALLTNTEGVTTARPFLGVPNSAVVSRCDFQSTVAPTTRATAHGSVNQLVGVTGSGIYYAPTVYAVGPSAYYEAACWISTVDGAVVGRGGLASPAATSVVVSNGIIRATVSSTAMTLAFWDDSTSAWESNLAMAFFTVTGPTAMTCYGATVLKNAADECSVRLSAKAVISNQIFRWTVDLTLRRGDAYIRAASYGTQQLRATSAVALTATTWGARSTAADADGQYLLLTGADVAHDLANGRVSNNSGGTVGVFMAGFAETLGSAGPYDTDSVGVGFFRAHGTSQRVVVG